MAVASRFDLGPSVVDRGVNVEAGHLASAQSGGGLTLIGN